MSDKILLKGNSKLLKPVITQLMAMHQLLENLDVEGGSSVESEMHPSRRYHPHIRLHFKQDTNFVPGKQTNTYQGRRRKTGLLTFRMMDETSETISNAELSNIARKIKNIFGANNGYVWNKGKELYCYADWSKGYQLQILAKNKTQAADLVTNILSLQGHSPQWIYFTRTENSVELERYPETPVTKTILGEPVTLPVVRPLVDVRFTYADARIHKLIEPVILYDRTGKKVKPLVE